MGTLIEVLKTCIPIIVGALIAIVPSTTEKLISNKYEHKEKQQQEKQELYIELISVFSRVLKENRTERDLLLLRNKIRLLYVGNAADAWNMGITQDIQSASYINNTFAFRYVKQLMNDFCMSRVNVEWIVSVWCSCNRGIFAEKISEYRSRKSRFFI